MSLLSAVLLLWGCAQEGPSDASLMAQAVALPVEDAIAALALCAQISDPDLQGSCSLGVARRADAAPDVDPEALCPMLEDGPWRAECYFLAAEDWRRKNEIDRAGELCAKAGPFIHDCGQHLWQTALQRLAKGRRSTELSEVMPEAQALYTRWDVVLGDQSDLSTRFWIRFYSEGFDVDPSIDLSVCQAQPAERQVSCRQAGAQHYLKRLRELSAAPGGRATLCALGLSATSEQASSLPGLAASPHPALDVALQGALGEMCASGGPQPDHRLMERVLEAAAQGP